MNIIPVASRDAQSPMYVKSFFVLTLPRRIFHSHIP